MAEMNRLSVLANYLVTHFDKNPPQDYDKKIFVDPVVSEVAAWYEKLRNAMDWRDDDAILRAAIERILKRKFLMGGTPETMAEPLVRELIWARYFPEGSVPESIVDKVANIIKLYLVLQDKVNNKHRVNKGLVNEWILHLMSSAIENIISPSKYRELIANFMFQFYKDKVVITDDTPITKDAQIFLAIRRTYAKQDLPLLRYHLFIQIFGELNEERMENISDKFIEGYKQIEYQLNYPLRFRFQSFFKNQSIPFYILEDIFIKHKGENAKLINALDDFKVEVINTCGRKYKNIRDKVNRAIVRGVIFILITKAIFALGIEGTFERIVYGHIIWSSIALNTLLPPLLMVIVGLLIKTPDRENSIRIWEKIKTILFESPETTVLPLIVKKATSKVDPLLNLIFVILWTSAFLVTMGMIIYVLTLLNFNFISQAIFLFFLTIVSFISYRISQTAQMYALALEKPNIKSVLFDFFFTPVIQMGRQLTENISKINIILFVFDMFIETPFKTIFAFFEQWFLFLRTQREKLG